MLIDQFFHFMQIVDDIDGAQERYDALLGPQWWGPKGWSDFDKRWALLGNVGPDFVLEIMEPSTDQADLGSPLPKFKGRHGDHLHSLSWYTKGEDLRPLADRLRADGVRVVDAYGTLDEGDGAGKTFFTHPKDTMGQLEFQGVDKANPPERDVHLHAGWTGGSAWADQPLGLLRTSHLTTMVADLTKAKHLYGDVFEGNVFHEETTGDRTSAYVFVGTETVVELAQPTGGDTRIQRDFDAHGEMPHAMTFLVADLDRATAHVEAQGLEVLERTDDTIVLDPADLYQAVVAFTTRRLPNDPRA